MSFIANLRGNLKLETASWNTKLREASTNLSRTERAMRSRLGAIERQGTSTFDKLRQAVVLVNGPLGQVGARFQTMSAIVSSSGVAIGAMVVGLTGAVATLGFAARQSERMALSQNRLNALIKATGGSAGLMSEQIRDFSRGLGRATLTSTEAVERAAAKLLTFRSVAGQTFKETLTLAQDLAATGFGTLETNVVQLGKALEDPTNGISALTRVGVSFSAQQKEQIKQFMEMNDVASAQAIILGTLRDQVGGAGASEAQGLTGAFDTLGQEVGEFLEYMGNATGVLNTFTSAVNWASDVLHSFNEEFFTSQLTLQRQIEIQQDAVDGLSESYLSLKRAGDEAKAILTASGVKGVYGDDMAIAKAKAGLDAAKEQLYVLQQQAYRQAEVQSMASLSAKQEREREQRAAMAAQAEAGAIKIYESGISTLEKYETQLRLIREQFENGLLSPDSFKQAEETLLRQIREQEAKASKRGGSGKTKISDADKEQKKLHEELTRLLEGRRTKLEALNDERERFLELALRVKDISAEERAGIEESIQRIDKEIVEVQRDSDKLVELGNSIGESFASAFEDAIVEGKKFGDVMKALLKDIASQILRSQITSPIAKGLGGIFGNLLGGLFGGGGFANAKFAAEGGQLLPGRLTMVGENGPEAFVPRVGGTIIPNDQLGSGGGRNVFNVDMRGASVEAVARLEKLVRDVNGSIEQRAVAAVGEKKNRDPRYLRG